MECPYRPGPDTHVLGFRGRSLCCWCVSSQSPAVHIPQTCRLKQKFISHSPGHHESRPRCQPAPRSHQGLRGRVLTCLFQPLVAGGVRSRGATWLHLLAALLHVLSL